MATVLYVEDEAALRRAVHAWLEGRGDEVCSARTIGGAKEHLAEREFDGVFIDLWLPDGSGFELFDWIAERDAALAERVAFVTGDIIPSDATARQLAMLGRPLLVKPFDLAELDWQVRAWTERRPADAPRPPAERGGPEAQT
jgi:DNA-binding response OmpR family regulator